MDVRELSLWLRDELRQVNEKLDHVRDTQANMGATLAGQAKDIAHHIARTDALEARVEQVAADLTPVKEHVARLKGIAWFVGFLATALGTIAALEKFFQS